MCTLCDDKTTALKILAFADRHWTLAKGYGAEAVRAVEAGQTRKAQDMARQSAHHAMMGEHLAEEHDRRFAEYHGRKRDSADLAHTDQPIAAEASLEERYGNEPAQV
jgi:hypothetical protein